MAELSDGRLDVAAARLHLGTQLIEGKLVSITVLKNLLLGRAIAREDITLNLRKIIRSDRGTITETTIAEETTATESQEEQEDQDNPEEASATPRIMTVVILESLHHTTIIEQNQLTRDLIQSQYLDELRTKLSDAKTQISNMEQNQYILGQLGNFYSKPSVNPNTCYNNYGCGGCNGCNGCGCN